MCIGDYFADDQDLKRLIVVKHSYFLVQEASADVTGASRAENIMACMSKHIFIYV